MLFDELYSKNPQMLKSNEMIAYRDAIDNMENITAYLEKISLEKLGHFTFKESLSFLSDKINFKFSTGRINKLSNIYLIRNIITHNSGLLRPGQEKNLPNDLTIKDNYLRISKSYLERIHSTIKSSVTTLEKHVEKKFFNYGYHKHS